MKLAISLYGNIGISQATNKSQNNINLLKESEIANTDSVICCEGTKQ